ncbi:MAG: serine/threonine-protein kinase [Myxococcota bacterium]
MSGAPTPGPTRLGAPVRYGRYELCAELASGGMGTVFAARAEGPGGYSKPVALKRIHEHLAKDPRFLAMFLDEARLAARIQHPHVAGVIDFGEAEGSYYLAMPFVLGETLSHVIRRVSHLEAGLQTAFPFLACKLVIDACEGLHAAHELRDEAGELLHVVHRDVSPANLLVGYDGALQVIDFGVASARERLYSTVTGEVKGKFGYCAPEQLQSQPVDRRADVWSLGVVLWECLTRRRLFRRSGLGETVMAVTTMPIPPLGDFAEVPLELEEVVFKALNRDPERRYATAREMGQALGAALGELGHSVTNADVAEWMTNAFPSGMTERRALVEGSRSVVPVEVSAEATPPSSSRTVRLALAGVLLVAVSVGTTWALLGREPASPPVATSPSSPVEEEPEGSMQVATATEAELGMDGVNSGETDSAPSMSMDTATMDAASMHAASMDTASMDAASMDPASMDTASMDTAVAMRAVERGSGQVRVVLSRGWAYVYLGRRRLGEAPGSFTLPAGRHVLRVQPMGQGAGVRRRVRVRPGGSVRVNVDIP